MIKELNVISNDVPKLTVEIIDALIWSRALSCIFVSKITLHNSNITLGATMAIITTVIVFLNNNSNINISTQEIKEIMIMVF